MSKVVTSGTYTSVTSRKIVYTTSTKMRSSRAIEGTYIMFMFMFMYFTRVHLHVRARAIAKPYEVGAKCVHHSTRPAHGSLHRACVAARAPGLRPLTSIGGAFTTRSAARRTAACRCRIDEG